jgi:hypothetical protein
MSLTEIAVDDGPHNMDGLLLHAWDGSERVEAFISRRVMDVGSILEAPMKVAGVSSVTNTTHSARSTWRRLSELLVPNTSAVRLSTASTPSSMFCCQILWKAGKCSMQVDWYVNGCRPLFNGCKWNCYGLQPSKWLQFIRPHDPRADGFEQSSTLCCLRPCTSRAETFGCSKGPEADYRYAVCDSPRSDHDRHHLCRATSQDNLRRVLFRDDVS